MLGELAGEVYAVERLAPLAERARITLARLAYRNVRTVIADGTRGWPEAAPFDAILVAAAAPAPPPALLAQIADGGRLVIPLGSPQRDQVLTIFTRTGEGLSERQDTRCRFVPLIGDTEVGEGRQGAAAPGVRPAAAPALGYPEEDVAMKTVDARVYGIVQGVAYRDSVCAEARRLGLSGWVSNLSDGSVALRIQGEPALVDALLGWCRVGPPAARVTRVEVSGVEHGESLSGFVVR